MKRGTASRGVKNVALVTDGHSLWLLEQELVGPCTSSVVLAFISYIIGSLRSLSFTLNTCQLFLLFSRSLTLRNTFSRRAVSLWPLPTLITGSSERCARTPRALSCESVKSTLRTSAGPRSCRCKGHSCLLLGCIWCCDIEAAAAFTKRDSKPRRCRERRSPRDGTRDTELE